MPRRLLKRAVREVKRYPKTIIGGGAIGVASNYYGPLRRKKAKKKRNSRSRR